MTTFEAGCSYSPPASTAPFAPGDHFGIMPGLHIPLGIVGETNGILARRDAFAKATEPDRPV